MVRIGLEITHACNKYCSLCSHRISTSNHGHLTMGQYEAIVRAMDGLAVGEVLLIGGEPLVHPEFHEILRRVRKDFSGANLMLATNGAKLHTLSDEERFAFHEISVSFYGAWNEPLVREILQSPRKYHNVHFVDSRKMMDPDHDPCLDEETARQAMNVCNSRCTRIIGTHVYGCCLADGIARTYGVKGLHTETKPGWVNEFANLPTHKACQHCFYAAILLSNNALRFKSWMYTVLDGNWAGDFARKLRRFSVRRRLRKCLSVPVSQQ